MWIGSALNVVAVVVVEDVEVLVVPVLVAAGTSMC
jgi:hypothetical protein